MELQTAILIGPPGSGKGTQAGLLTDFLQKSKVGSDVLKFTTGKALRELTEASGKVGQRVQETLEDGNLLPAFLTAHLWTEAFVNELSPDTHLVLDGSPRSPEEAELLDDALTFYRREQPAIIHLDISEDTSFLRLQDRGRGDDDRETIRRRISQFQKYTIPVINDYKSADSYQYVYIDGERSVSAIQEDIRNCLT